MSIIEDMKLKCGVEDQSASGPMNGGLLYRSVSMLAAQVPQLCTYVPLFVASMARNPTAGIRDIVGS